MPSPNRRTNGYNGNKSMQNMSSRLSKLVSFVRVSEKTGTDAMFSTFSKQYGTGHPDYGRDVLRFAVAEGILKTKKGRGGRIIMQAGPNIRRVKTFADFL